MINLDYPSNSEDYVHRIGRTGRSQRTGTAYAFFTPANAHKASDLIQVLEEAKQVVNPKLYELSRNPGVYKSKYRSFFISLPFLFFFYIYTLFFFLQRVTLIYFFILLECGSNDRKLYFKFSVCDISVAEVVYIFLHD